MNLQDRVAMITGGGSGIGRAISLVLAKDGAKVAVLDLNVKNASGTAREIESLGGHSLAAECDVGSRESCFSAVDEITKRWGRLDILITCAGILIDNVIKKITEETWDKVHRINLKGTLFCIQAVQEIMKQQQYGRILTLASGAYLGGFGQAAYGASKAGVVNLTKVAALEMAKYGVTVNCIAPGLVETPMTAGMPQDAYAKIAKTIPVGRIAKPEDIAHLARALVADEASYITGQIIFVDGGATLGRA